MVRWISLRAAASTVIVACSLATGSIAAQAQHSDDLKSLNQQVVRLHSAAKYAEAADIAKLALVLAERTFSPGHPEVDLALLYHAQGRFAEAEPPTSARW